MALHFPSPIPQLKQSLTFIHVPKTGGTSFTHWIATNSIPHENQSIHADVEKAKSFWPDLGYCFALVRNPYARLVSYFHYVGQNAEHRVNAVRQGQELKKRVDIDREHSILQTYRQGFYYWFRSEITGETTAMTQDKTFMNWRRSQVSWVQGCDRVIQLENFAEEFEWLQHYFHCHEPLPMVNVSKHGCYQDYYNTETRNWVQSMFQQDLDELHYTF